ncbi:MAG: hypothetical protein J6T96_12530 [Bacteroidales bacterium]|nr:hypothetical protein [Bacteroidales bacterium]MBP5682523.1 hypothetical protein [Bacteroidales bacterium]
MKFRYIRNIELLTKHTSDMKALPGDVICVTGRLGKPYGNEGDQSPTPLSEKRTFLLQSKYVHSLTMLSNGLDAELKVITNRSNVSAEIELENIPFSDAMMKEYGSHLSQLYQTVLHGDNNKELLLTVDSIHFADLNAQYYEKFGEKLLAFGRIVNGDPNHINYIENGFGLMSIGSQWEHLC